MLQHRRCCYPWPKKGQLAGGVPIIVGLIGLYCIPRVLELAQGKGQPELIQDLASFSVSLVGILTGVLPFPPFTPYSPSLMDIYGK